MGIHGVMLLSAEGVTKVFGHREVISDASLVIEKGESIGLVGDNGAGKTTLIRILMGEIGPDSGEVRRRTDRIGYLPQIPDFSSTAKVRDTIEAPYGQVSMLTRRLAEVERLMSGPSADWAALGDEYGLLQEEIAQAKGRSFPSFTDDAFSEIGLDPSVLDRRMAQLSGGEVTKVMLARIMVQSRDVDLLFLDEPTSHLDVPTMEWLEDYLIDLPSSIVTISHDRYFLDRVATRVLDLHGGRTRSYIGSFTEYTVARELEDQARDREALRNQSERRRQERVIENQQRRWRYMTTFKTRKRLLERTAAIEGPDRPRAMDFHIATTVRGGVNVMMGKDFIVKRDGEPVIRVREIDLETGDRLGIFGPNGSGKSTLVKGLMGELELEGEFWIAPGATIGYFAQSHDGLDPDLTAEEQLMRATGPQGKALARKTLSSFLITGKDAERRISTLSGGERAKVALANLVVSGRNLLVLDEPTNYLDIRSRDAVERALQAYAGTIVMVSHDRYLLDGICTRIGAVHGGEMAIFPGNYSEVKRRFDLESLKDRVEVFEATKKFTDWSTGRRYRQGDRVEVPVERAHEFKRWVDDGILRPVER